MPTRPTILVVLSSSPQGWYLPEFAHPYEILAPYADLTIASPAGGPTTMDPVSVTLWKDDASAVEFKDTKSDLWTKTEKLESFLGRAKEFTAILYVGGFGREFLFYFIFPFRS
jgi:putative intracellular protease/amidase